MKKTILIIDDDDAVQNVLGDYLQQKGFLTRHADEGEEGLRMAFESPPDLVILDLLLHGQDGYQTLEQFSAAFPDLPVIVLTGLAGDEEMNADVASLGGAACLKKTDAFDSLLSFIESFLREGSDKDVV